MTRKKDYVRPAQIGTALSKISYDIERLNQVCQAGKET
jgi:hypothetical protein